MREQWGSQTGFILAAIGSAVGLGNIWRFPGVAYDNGGGAFLIPYLVALITAGIPILFLDYAIGHRFRGSAPTALRRLGGSRGRWLEGLGWFQVAIAFVIAIYYAVVIAWAMSFFVFSFDLRWGDDPARIRDRRASWTTLCGDHRVACVFATLRAADVAEGAAELERAIEGTGR